MIIKKCKLIKYRSLPSTNDEAKKISLKYDKPICVWAEEQTNGRGRFKRNWISLKDNLTISYILYPSVNISNFQLYSIITSLAVYDLFISLGIKRGDLLIKWPNDILLKNKKVAGILLELGEKNFDNQNSLIIGIGINLNTFPNKNEIDDNFFEATSLNQEIKNLPNRKEILTTLNESLIYWNNTFITIGFDHVKKTFLKRTFPFKKKINIKLFSKEKSGFFYGISNEGCMFLKTENGIEKISSGEIY